MAEPTRIEALSLTVGGGGAAELVALAGREANAFAVCQFRLRERIVEVTIPDLDSPSAEPAGTAIITQDAPTSSGMERQIQGALCRLGCAGSADMSLRVRTVLVAEFVIAGDDRCQRFWLLKGRTRDRCRLPETGLVHGLTVRTEPTKPNASAANKGSAPDGPPRR